MKTIDIKTALSLPVFSHAMLKEVLKKDIKNINDKIANLVNSGEIIRLKRGFYILSKPYLDRPIDLISVANMLYSPSYVSLDYALSYYGMILERVSEVTSVTSKNAKFFDTPIGRFSYKKASLNAFSLGVDWLEDEKNGGKFIATPEKALCDKIRYDRGMGTLTQKQMREYIVYDLRLDLHFELNYLLVEKIANAYKSKNLVTLATMLQKRKI